MTHQIGKYNVTIYPDTVFDKGKAYCLVVIDKFSEKNEYDGHKHFYFTYVPGPEEFTEGTLDSLWDFPVGTRVTGQRIIWTAQQ